MSGNLKMVVTIQRWKIRQLVPTQFVERPLNVRLVPELVTMECVSSMWQSEPPALQPRGWRVCATRMQCAVSLSCGCGVAKW